MSVSYWNDQVVYSSKTIKKDVVIIGGGLSGHSIAFWLQKEDPHLNVAVVEKHHLGDGATGRNAGFITCGSVEHFNRLVETHGKEKAKEIWDFSEKNLWLLKEHIIKDEKEKIFFEEKGSFSLASGKNEFIELQKTASLMSSMDIEVELIEEKAVKKRLGAEGFVGGIKYCNDASVNPILLLKQMRERIEEQGTKVQFYEHHEVHSVEQRGDVRIVKTNKAHFETSLVVYATNGYSGFLNKYFKDKIFPTRGQILMTEPLSPFMEGPCYANFVLDYFRQLPTGEIIIGGFRQLQKDVEVGLSDEITDIIQDALEAFLGKHLPLCRHMKITHRWSGVMGFSADGQPMVGALPSDSQTYFLGGFTAHGLGLAFHTGKVLSDLIYGREIPAFISAKRWN
jgi:glycine/D-amino acid oxidase-like deaminating enzyme